MKIHLCILIAAAGLLVPVRAFGQLNNPVGACAPADADAYLDAGNVRARIFNNSGLFYQGGYEIPQGSGLYSIWASSIWVVGMVDNELRAAAAHYGAWEFWPGPLDESGNPPSDCTPFDTLWEIRTRDIQEFVDTGHISENLRSWPWHLGAPVIDGDGIPDNYNLAGGDLPELYGDQRLWWVMNDRGNAHQRTKSLPIGLEVHGSAHAFGHPGFVGDVTFYEFTLIHRNEAPLEEAYFSFFADTDLGDWGDDYIGSDSLLHLGYTYNGSAYDGNLRTGWVGYGYTPPALGLTYLETPLAEADGLDNDRDGEVDEPGGEMTGVTSVVGHYVDVHEWSRPDYLYNFSQGLRRDGTPVQVGPFQTTTRFMYPADPVTASFWSEMNGDGEGVANAPSDRKILVSSGPYSMAPGDTARFRIAIVWARGDNNLDSVTLLKRRVRSLHSSEGTFFASRPLSSSPVPLEPSHVLGFKQNYPNPFSQTTTLSYSLPKPMQVRLAVYDLLGREVALLADQPRAEGIYTVEFDAGTLPAGVYIAQLELDYLRFTKRMVIVD